MDYRKVKKRRVCVFDDHFTFCVGFTGRQQADRQTTNKWQSVVDDFFLVEISQRMVEKQWTVRRM